MSTSKEGKEPRVLIMDVESSLAQFASFGPINPYIVDKFMIQDFNILTIAWSWFGEDNIYVDSVPSSRMWDDKSLILRVKKVIESADIVVGHNWDKFDQKKIQGRAMANDIGPILFPPSVDTLKVAKKVFSLTYNKLDYIAKLLGVSRKMQVEGDLWMRILRGDATALDRMATYNMQDVEVQSEVYAALLPFIDNHPNMTAILKSKDLLCRNCGSSHLIKHGEYVSNTGRYQRYKCQTCGSTTREAKALETYNGR